MELSSQSCNIRYARMIVYKFLFILGDARFLKQPSTTLFFLVGEQRRSIICTWESNPDLRCINTYTKASYPAGPVQLPFFNATNSILVPASPVKLKPNFNSKTHSHPLGQLFPLVINTTKNLNKAGSGKYLSQESIKLECDYASLEKAAFQFAFTSPAQLNGFLS